MQSKSRRNDHRGGRGATEVAICDTGADNPHVRLGHDTGTGTGTGTGIAPADEIPRTIDDPYLYVAVIIRAPLYLSRAAAP
jgi:hypothetical protein